MHTLIVHTFDHPGSNGGTWYAATYPHAATRYYAAPAARQTAIDNYRRTIEATGGKVITA